MDALRFLRAQHDELRTLFRYYARADGARKRRLFLRLADLIAAHDAIEERLFYPAVFVGPLRGMLRQYAEEHLAAKRTLADLLELRIGDVRFEAKMKVLEELVELHLRNEEVTLFPLVRANFTGQEMDFLGSELQAFASEMLREEPRRRVPEETGDAAPLD